MAKKKQKVLRLSSGPLRDPRSGKFIKATKANVERIAREVAREYRKAVADRNKWARKRFAGAKQATTLKRIDKAYRTAARKAAKLAPKVAKVQEQVSEAKAMTSRVRLPRVIEFGLNYQASRGIAGDVNINIRVRRADGRGISKDDAWRAIMAIARGERSIPGDLEIAAVEWQRPSRGDTKGRRGGGWRRGDSEDVWSFSSIIAEMVFGKEKGNGIRIGEVKEDVL
jgi:hypothetical protein